MSSTTLIAIANVTSLVPPLASITTHVPLSIAIADVASLAPRPSMTVGSNVTASEPKLAVSASKRLESFASTTRPIMTSTESWNSRASSLGASLSTDHNVARTQTSVSSSRAGSASSQLGAIMSTRAILAHAHAPSLSTTVASVSNRLSSLVTIQTVLTNTEAPASSTTDVSMIALRGDGSKAFWHEASVFWKVLSDKMVAAPMKAIAAILLVVCAVVTWFYLERDAGCAYLFVSIIGFHLVLCAILLAPYDVWAALVLEEQETSLVHGGYMIMKEDDGLVCSWDHLVLVWRSLYAIICILCYIIMPLMIEFEAAPGFTFRERFRIALRMNLAWYAAYILIGIVVVAWLCYKGTFKGTADIAAFGIVTSHAYALLLITGLMGFGLVAMPQHLLFMSSLSRQRSASYLRVLETERARDKSRIRLRDLIRKAHIVLADETDNLALRPGLAVVQKTLQDCQSLLWTQLPPATTETDDSTDADDYEQGLGARGAMFKFGSRRASMASLAHLCNDLKLARMAANLEVCRWQDVMQHALVLDDIMELEQGGKAWSTRTAWRKLVTIWPRVLRPWICWILAWVCGALSGLIAISQLATSAGWNFLSPLALPFTENHGFIVAQIFSMIPLCYMALATYWSIFRLEVSGMYCIYPNHHTDVCSILMCSKYTAQLACPICYQFILLLNVPGPPGSALQNMMGTVNDVPFAIVVSNFASVLIVVLIIVNLFGLYSRVVRKLGLKTLDFERQDFENNELDRSPSVEARAMIERARTIIKHPSASQLTEPTEQTEPTELSSLINGEQDDAAHVGQATDACVSK